MLLFPQSFVHVSFCFDHMQYNIWSPSLLEKHRLATHFAQYTLRLYQFKLASNTLATTKTSRLLNLLATLSPLLSLHHFKLVD